MSLIDHGAQRASRHRFPSFVVALVATAFAFGGLAASPPPADAAAVKVVVVVGPSGGSTSNYIYNARKLATQARGYGATVVEIYTPRATWARVKAAAQGANVLIYLGHGNGWPSPYGPYQPYTKDGFGLNPYDGSGNYKTKYVGEYYIGRDIKLAPNAVVVFNRLCYASGNSEPGHANPTKSTAMKRADNYGAGFLKAGAKAVFAEGVGSAGYILSGLFRSDRSVAQIFWSAPNRTRTYSFTFRSSRTAGAEAIMDPRAPSSYYRSVVGDIRMLAGTFRP